MDTNWPYPCEILAENFNMYGRTEHNMILIIATHNPGKVREIGAILSGVSMECQSLDDLGILEDIDETGDTYMANALLKANFATHATHLPALGDDSGLEVD